MKKRLTSFAIFAFLAFTLIGFSSCLKDELNNAIEDVIKSSYGTYTNASQSVSLTISNGTWVFTPFSGESKSYSVTYSAQSSSDAMSNKFTVKLSDGYSGTISFGSGSVTLNGSLPYTGKFTK